MAMSMTMPATIVPAFDGVKPVAQDDLFPRHEELERLGKAQVLLTTGVEYRAVAKPLDGELA